jgi:hypothetical protein
LDEGEDWREETARELRSAAERLASVARGLAGEPDEEEMREVWLAYVLVEKGIFFIKVELDEENPGRMIDAKRYAVPDERQALQFAMKNLKKGTESFALGDLFDSLKWLRESRNYLRVLLRQKSLRKVRRAR